MNKTVNVILSRIKRFQNNMARYTWNNIFQKRWQCICHNCWWYTISDPIEITGNFNTFFTSVGKNLQKKIPPTKKTSVDYLEKPNSENFIIAPTTSDEINYFFKIGIHSMKGWIATMRHGFTRQKSTKRLQHTGNLFRKNLQLKDVC